MWSVSWSRLLHSLLVVSRSRPWVQQHALDQILCLQTLWSQKHWVHSLSIGLSHTKISSPQPTHQFYCNLSLQLPLRKSQDNLNRWTITGGYHPLSLPLPRSPTTQWLLLFCSGSLASVRPSVGVPSVRSCPTTTRLSSRAWPPAPSFNRLVNPRLTLALSTPHPPPKKCPAPLLIVVRSNIVQAHRRLGESTRCRACWTSSTQFGIDWERQRRDRFVAYRHGKTNDRTPDEYYSTRILMTH